MLPFWDNFTSGTAYTESNSGTDISVVLQPIISLGLRVEA